MDDVCWSKEGNAHLRPANWGMGPGGRVAANLETGVVNANQGEATEQEEEGEYTMEMLLAQVHSFGSDYSQVESIPTEGELNRLDPEVWIADTGATTHSMAHPDHGIRPCEAKESDNVMGVAGPPV